MGYKTFKQIWKESGERLNEMSPYLFPTRKELQALPSLSTQSIEDETRFNFLGDIPEFDLSVFENKETGGILAGTVTEERFFVAFNLACEERSLFVKKMQLSDKRKHIALVLVDKKLSGGGIAGAVYQFVAERYDLVSDRLQYLGARDLWKSLARRDVINVYVFDESERDYLRDEDGEIIKYNGTNIDDDYIWGQEQEHQDRLLVATVHDLV